MPAGRPTSDDRPVVAGWGRRILALFVDWFVALLTVSALTKQPFLGGPDADPWLPLLVFWVEVTLLTGLLGFSIGKRVTGLTVVGVNGRPIGLVRAALRTLLLCLVIPPLVQNEDRRGLHDLAAGSLVTPLRP